MDGRNSSSSPDPLEYPGDPKFLLSSATKSISRRATLSPRKSQTPMRSASIKPLSFQDVVLPSTPQRGRSSLSPSKTTLQSEGNVSPWRIRVTVEAEPEDDENGGGAAGGQNGMLGWKDATTTKVPLKGGQSSTEPTPKKRRTPRRKSVSERTPTPRRRKSSASPEKASAGSTPKRGRGRPRKSLQAIDANGDQPKPSPSGLVQDTTPRAQSEDPFLDIPVHHSPANEPPTNGAGSPVFEHSVDNAIPDQASGNENLSEPPPPNEPEHRPEMHLTPEPSPQPGDGSSPGNTLHAGRTPRPKFPRYPTPRSSSLLEGDGANAEHRTSMQSAREMSGTKRRRLNDPTTVHREFDSIVESEGFSMVSLNTLPSAKQQLNSASKAGVEAASNLLSHSQASHASSRPLQPLPIAAASPPRVEESSPNQIYPATGDVAYPTLNIGEQISSPEHAQQGTGITSPQLRSPGLSDLRRRKPLRRLVRVIRAGIALDGVLKRQHQVSTLQFPYFGSSNNPDEDIAAARQRLDDLFEEFDPETQRELSAGLRFGEEMAFMKEQNEESQPDHETGSRDDTATAWEGNEEQQQEHEADSPGDMPIEWEQNEEWHQEQEAGSRGTPNVWEQKEEWRLGHETGSRENMTTTQEKNEEWRRDDESAPSSDIGPPPHITSPSTHSQEEPSPTPTATPRNDSTRTLEAKMAVEMERRQQEWQREREAISRQIEAANSSQVIVINDEQDNEPSSASDVEEETPKPHRQDMREQQDEESVMGSEPEEEHEYDEEPYEGNYGQLNEGEGEDGEDVFRSEGYEDIWQEEAQKFAAPQLEEHAPSQPRLPRWEIRQYTEAQDDEGRRIPDWGAPDSDRSMLGAGKTQMAKYRDGDFEFSSLLGTPESATRRFYQDDIQSPPEMVSPHDNLQSAQPQWRTDPYARRTESSPRAIKVAPSNEAPPEPMTSPKMPVRSHDPSYEDPRLLMDEEYMHIVEDQSESDPDDIQPPHRETSSLSPDRSSASSRQSDQMDYEFTDPQTVAPNGPRAPPVPDAARDDQAPHTTSQMYAQEQQHESLTPSSWFNRLTGLMPSWLTSKVSRGLDSGKAHEAIAVRKQPEAEPKQNGRKPVQVTNHATQTSTLLQPTPRTTPPRAREPLYKPLSLGGYFTNDHFSALYALYCEAKRHPERFPYESTPERDALVGQWLYSLGGYYPRKITEIQIGIMIRFRRELVEDSKRHDGPDQLGWSELYILWRLWSIIVGEKLRRERKLAYRAQTS